MPGEDKKMPGEQGIKCHFIRMKYSNSAFAMDRAMASHILGFLPPAANRELKFALESFWDGKSSAEELQKVAVDLRSAIWKHMAGAVIKFIPSNTFSYYDQVLDTTSMVGAVPATYNWNGEEIGFDVYFSMARGNGLESAMEMTKWFDTDSYYVVPELGPDVIFSYASHKALEEYKEAKSLGVDTIPVLLGPVSYLLLSKPAEAVEKSFSPLSLIDKILPVYKEVVADLKAAGATWIQFDEPTVARDLNAHQLQAFTHAYGELESSLSGLNVLIQTYFADVTAEAYKTLISLKAVTAFGFDFAHGTETFDLIMGGFPSGKFLFAGVVNGGDNWPDNLEASLSTLLLLEGIVGKDKVVVSTPANLLHEAVYLAKALSVQKEEAFFFAEVAAFALRIYDAVRKAKNVTVEYFGEQLSGFAFTINGWIPSLGSCSMIPLMCGDLSAGKQSRSALLSISATLEMSDRVFLKKEANEEILKSLESMKNAWLKAKSDIVIVNESVCNSTQYMKSLLVEHAKAIHDLEEEITGVKKLIKKLDKAYERLVLRTIELIKQVRDCKAIVIAREYELHLLMAYCIADQGYGSGAVPNKMVEIHADLKGEERKDVIHKVQMRGWLCRFI